MRNFIQKYRFASWHGLLCLCLIHKHNERNLMIIIVRRFGQNSIINNQLTGFQPRAIIKILKGFSLGKNLKHKHGYSLKNRCAAHQDETYPSLFPDKKEVTVTDTN